MANSNKPNGFTLIGTYSGAPINANIRTRQMTGATAIFPGDAVSIDDATGLVVPASAGSLVLGVCVGVKVDRSISSTEHPGYAAASSGAYIFVAEGPDYLYEVQEDSVGGTPLALTNIGSNGDLVAGSGSTTLGTSAQTLDTSDVIAKDASAATAQFKVVDLVNRVDNAVGNYARWVVSINEDFYRDTTGI
jgi:hypothetical protein